MPKNGCFRTVVLEKTLEILLDCKEIRPVHSKGNCPEYSLEGLILKLKLQYFGHLMWGADSLKKTPIVRKAEGRRRRGRQRMRWMDGITDLMDTSKLEEIEKGQQGSLVCCSSWSKESDTTEGLNDKEESRSKIEH